MITESVRAIADFLEHATYGINAILPNVPRETDVTVPAAITIYDETRDPEIARDQVPNTLPALLVSTAATPIDQSNPANKPYPADMLVDVLIRYVVSRSQTDVSVAHSHLVVRAILKNINYFMQPAQAALRTRNQVQIWHVPRVSVANTYTSNDDNLTTQSVLVTLQCRDLFAIS